MNTIKVKYFIIFTIIFTVFSAIPVFCDNNQNNMIKVGISSYTGISSISISENNIEVGFFRNDDFISSGDINIEKITIRPISGNYKKLGDSFQSFGLALNYASNNNGIPVLSDLGEWFVYIADSSAQSTQLGKNSIAIYSADKCLMIFDSSSCYFSIRSKNGKTTLGNKNTSYRGYIQFYRKGSAFNIINVIDIDQYLYGVLASEMSPLWHIEALKAQSVASRNYAISYKNRHIDNGYDVCDTTHCQSYGGTEKETDSIIQAVDASSGKMIYYNNEPINAFFHSSSGGNTANAKDVWGIDAPYLNAVDDKYETEGKVWVRTFSLNEITNLLNASGSNIGNASGVTISEVDKNGRVNKLTINGTNGSKVLENENIRTFFSGASGGSLESRNFVIGNSVVYNQKNSISIIGDLEKDTTVLDKVFVYTKDDNFNTYIENANTDLIFIEGSSGVEKYNSITTITKSQEVSSGNISFAGKGWGHGVGMSQYGAKGMAENGFDYIQILQYYYEGTEVK